MAAYVYTVFSRDCPRRRTVGISNPMPSNPVRNNVAARRTGIRSAAGRNRALFRVEFGSRADIPATRQMQAQTPFKAAKTRVAPRKPGGWLQGAHGEAGFDDGPGGVGGVQGADPAPVGNSSDTALHGWEAWLPWRVSRKGGGR